MKKTLLCLGFFILMATFIFGQNSRNCGTMQYLNEQKEQDATLESRMQQIESQTAAYISAQQNERLTTGTITIPVVFHVIYNSNAQNISDARILEQLNVLNNDYAKLNSDITKVPSVFQGATSNTGIQFCLAKRTPTGLATTGIIRKSSKIKSFSTNNFVKYTSKGGDDAWPCDSYLNIWVCNLGQGLLGYAQFPGGKCATDGVVVLYSSVGGPNSKGTATSYDLGRTATHEVGHWLNLRHIWGDATCGDDLVSDTPTSQTANYGCPTFPHVTCSNGPNGDMFMNYMDYTDDACMFMFTSGQSTRMNAIFGIGGARANMLNSQGCNAVVAAKQFGKTSLSDNAQLNEMSVYPNPSQGMLNISFISETEATANVRITDMVGKLVFSQEVTVSEGSNTFSFNMSTFSKGIYLVEVKNNSNMFKQRWMIEK